MIQWKPISGWEGLYSVSNTGEVWSERTGKLRAPTITRNGHVAYTLEDGSKRKAETHAAHRLVYEHFIGPVPDGMCVCHNNSNPVDNRVENLRADTYSSNYSDTLATGKYGKKLLPIDVKAIRLWASKGFSLRRIAEAFGVTDVTIGHVVNRRTWAVL
jgi:hypothetical protein